MSAATASAIPQKTPREVWLISAGHGLTHWYTATFYLLLPLIGKELGLSYTEIGLIMTIQNLAGAIANLPGGMLVDTVGKKGYLMATSLFWVGFPYALMSLTHSFWMLPACVTLAGAGVGIEFGVTAIGSAISPALFGMIADAYDLYTGFYFLAGIIAASNFLIVFIPNSAAVQARPVAVNRTDNARTSFAAIRLESHGLAFNAIPLSCNWVARQLPGGE